MTRLQNGNYSVKTALSTNWATFNVSTSGHTADNRKNYLV